MPTPRTPRAPRVPLAARLVAVLAVVLVALPGCGAGREPDRPVVAVSTNILGDVVGELVGDQVEVLTLMKPDADPHSFQVSAQEAARLRAADLVVSNGLGLEEGLQQHLDAAAADGVRAFAAGDVIDVLEHREGDAVGLPDPHFWNDPARMLDVVDALGPALATLDGVDPGLVAARTDDYRTRLRALDAEMSASFAAIPEARRALVTNHHVFGYLADRFDFEVVGAVVPSGTTLAAPSASDLAALVDAVRRTGVPVVFAESSSPDRLVQALAREAGVHVQVVELFTESLTAPDGGAPTYLTLMRSNTERIATGLSA